MSNKPKRCVMQFIIHPSPTIFGWYYTSHSVNHQLLQLMVWYASFNSHLLVWRQIITSTSTWYINDLNIDNAYFKSLMYTRIELFTKLKDIKYHVINAHVRVFCIRIKRISCDLWWYMTFIQLAVGLLCLSDIF